MEAIKMTLSEKIEQELERDLQKAMEDKDFNLLVKRLKISKDLAKKNNTSLQDTCSELKNCSNCQGDRKSTRMNSSHNNQSRMPSSA